MIWSQKAYTFLEEQSKAPDTVNPSLWSNSVNNHAYGLFEVTDGIYQVRGYDMANLTVIEGDSGKVIEKAREDFAKGEYQWVAEIMNVLVYADPSNQDARYLCADALEQLGYQAESGTWRNAYLSAAEELRHGNSAAKGRNASGGFDMQKNMSASMLFDYISIVLNKKNLEQEDFWVAVSLTDTKEDYTIHFNHGVMLVYEGLKSDTVDVSLTCPKNALFLILKQNYEGVAKSIQVEGDDKYLKLIMDNLTEFDISANAQFHIIEP